MELIETKVSGELKFSGKILKLTVDDVLLADGSPAKREVIHHPGGVGILPVDDEGMCYMVRQFRYPPAQAMLEIPAGKIREYENVFEVLRREVWEETGLHITKIQGEEERGLLDIDGNKTISFSPYCVTQNLSGAYSIILNTFICEAEGDLLERTNETKNIHWMKKDELKKIIDNSPESIFLMHVHALRKYLR